MRFKTLSAIPLLVAANISFAAQSPVEMFSVDQKAEIEQIIHDYLLKNPQVLVEVAQNLEKQQQEQAQKQFQDIVSEIKANKNLPRRGGGDNPKHYLIEFFDYNCGYCKKIRPLVAKLAKEHSDLQIIYVELPILSELSIKASTIAQALFAKDPQKYFVFQDKLMSEQKRLSSVDDIKMEIEALDVDFDELTEIAKNKNVGSILSENVSLGRTLGITGVPFMILDDQVIRGAVNDYKSLEEMLKK